MFCINCGNKLSYFSRKCKVCGFRRVDGSSAGSVKVKTNDTTNKTTDKASVAVASAATTAAAAKMLQNEEKISKLAEITSDKEKVKEKKNNKKNKTPRLTQKTENTTAHVSEEVSEASEKVEKKDFMKQAAMAAVVEELIEKNQNNDEEIETEIKENTEVKIAADETVKEEVKEKEEQAEEKPIEEAVKEEAKEKEEQAEEKPIEEAVKEEAKEKEEQAEEKAVEEAAKEEAKEKEEQVVEKPIEEAVKEEAKEKEEQAEEKAVEEAAKEEAKEKEEQAVEKPVEEAVKEEAKEKEEQVVEKPIEEAVKEEAKEKEAVEEKKEPAAELKAEEVKKELENMQEKKTVSDKKINKKPEKTNEITIPSGVMYVPEIKIKRKGGKLALILAFLSFIISIFCLLMLLLIARKLNIIYFQTPFDGYFDSGFVIEKDANEKTEEAEEEKKAEEIEKNADVKIENEVKKESADTILEKEESANIKSDNKDSDEVKNADAEIENTTEAVAEDKEDITGEDAELVVEDKNDAEKKEGIEAASEDKKDVEKQDDSDKISDDDKKGESDEKNSDEKSSKTEVKEASEEKLDGLFEDYVSEADEDLVAQVEEYTIEKDLKNIENSSQYRFNSESQLKLTENGFYVSDYSSGKEFFDVYKENEKNEQPSFITADSWVHTCELYVKNLIRNTEDFYLYDMLEDFTEDMQSLAVKEYEKALEDEKVSDSDKEKLEKDAVLFTVAKSLFYSKSAVDDDMSDDIVKLTKKELSKIKSAEDIEESAVFEKLDVDYTEFMPDGYYTESKLLKKYYLAAKWYKEFIFNDDNEEITKTVKLFKDKLDIKNKKKWEETEEIFEFIDELKNGKLSVSDEEADEQLQSALKETSVFNSILRTLVNKDKEGYPVFMQSEEWQAKSTEAYLGGLAESASNLAATKIQGDKTETILDNEDKSDDEETDDKKVEDKKSDDKKSDNNKAEDKKSDDKKSDDNKAEDKKLNNSNLEVTESGNKKSENYKGIKGYIQPEAEMYSRIKYLTNVISDRLSEYEMLEDENKKTLETIGEISGKFMKISEKELLGEELDKEEYELIKDYGYVLEKIWNKALALNEDEEYINTDNYPAVYATVVDENEDGVRQFATGVPTNIYVIADIDGKLTIARGSVYSFYDFQNEKEKLDNEEWRIMNKLRDARLSENILGDMPQRPEWTDGYRYSKK